MDLIIHILHAAIVAAYKWKINANEKPIVISRFYDPSAASSFLICILAIFLNFLTRIIIDKLSLIIHEVARLIIYYFEGPVILLSKPCASMFTYHRWYGEGEHKNVLSTQQQAVAFFAPEVHHVIAAEQPYKRYGCGN